MAPVASVSLVQRRNRTTHGSVIDNVTLKKDATALIFEIVIKVDKDGEAACDARLCVWVCLDVSMYACALHACVRALSYRACVCMRSDVGF